MRLNRYIFLFTSLPALWAVFCLAPLTSVEAQQSVVVVLDDSGSMGERMADRTVKMDAAKQALLSVLGELPPDAEVGVLALNSRGVNGPWVVPFGPVDESVYRPQIEQIRDNGGTPLGEAMKTAADRLLEKRRTSVYGTFRLLVVTDGEASDQYLLESYLPAIRSRGLTLDVIGVSMKGDHSLASAANTYRRADDPESLRQAVSEVFAESGGDDSDSSADFDLLSGLPDDVAESALTALANGNSNNAPIEAMEPSEAGAMKVPGSGTTRPSPGQGSNGLSFVADCFGCFAVLVIAIGMLAFLAVVMRRRR